MNKPLNIGGIIPLTTVDYPQHLSAVIFCQGCPYQCIYCHNRHLIPNTRTSKISWFEVCQFLEQRQGLLDAIVFSGGEPLMQSALLDAIQTVKERGFKVGLHTTGAYPEALKKILSYLDWIGFDIKAPFSDYQKITGMSLSGDKPRQSLKMLIHQKSHFECRTTYHSSIISEKTIMKLAYELKEMGVSKYTLQPLRKQGTLVNDLPDEESNLIDTLNLKIQDLYSS